MDLFWRTVCCDTALICALMSVNGHAGRPDYCASMGTDPNSLRDALRQVVDHEVGMNIVDLGLVYRLEKTLDGVQVDMTMTSPNCETSARIVAEAREVLQRLLPPWAVIDVRLVWEPEWSPWFMSASARAHFGWNA